MEAAIWIKSPDSERVDRTLKKDIKYVGKERVDAIFEGRKRTKAAVRRATLIA